MRPANCILCRRDRAKWTFAGRTLCEPCVQRAARLACDPEIRGRIWGTEGAVPEGLREVLEEFRNGWNDVDPRTHADLAAAYRDMGLVGEGLTETITSIVGAPDGGVPELAACLLFVDLTDDKVALLRQEFDKN